MDEESIPLTTFNAPQGHYALALMPFGSKMHLKYFKEEWILSLKTLITVV